MSDPNVCAELPKDCQRVLQKHGIECLPTALLNSMFRKSKAEPKAELELQSVDELIHKFIDAAGINFEQAKVVAELAVKLALDAYHEGFYHGSKCGE